MISVLGELYTIDNHRIWLEYYHFIKMVVYIRLSSQLDADKKSEILTQKVTFRNIGRKRIQGSFDKLIYHSLRKINH